jgi:formylglycine-generating enzyme required for sulfatase activity
MKQLRIFVVFAVFVFAATAPRIVNLKANALPGAKPGTVFRDCPDCPEMVVIPAGSFTMGSPDSEKAWATNHGAPPQSISDEAPQRSVTLRSFAIGKYDVTRAEYAVFVRETGYPLGDGCGKDSFKWNKQPDLNWKSPGFNQSDRDPVVCMSWHDAHAYIAWLNGKLGRNVSKSNDGQYRLPSEAEWEYAARAGTTTRFWWGNDENGAATHAWYKENSDAHTHAVGLKPANRFGLYDIVGNVWQWTQDCYAESYARAPTDGSPAENAPDCMRVDRGSCWLYRTWLLRSATRERNPADFRDVIMGFRVAKTLP